MIASLTMISNLTIYCPELYGSVLAPELQKSTCCISWPDVIKADITRAWLGQLFFGCGLIQCFVSFLGCHYVTFLKAIVVYKLELKNAQNIKTKLSI